MTFNFQGLDQALQGINRMLDSPQMWLLGAIREAREEERNHELVILLNIFFESLISTWIEERREQMDLADREEEWLDKSYHHNLRLARDLDMISDSEFHLLDLLKESRNYYAHNVKALHPDRESPIEQEEKLEDIYQKFAELPASVAANLE